MSIGFIQSIANFIKVEERWVNICRLLEQAHQDRRCLGESQCKTPSTISGTNVLILDFLLPPYLSEFKYFEENKAARGKTMSKTEEDNC